MLNLQPQRAFVGYALLNYSDSQAFFLSQIGDVVTGNADVRVDCEESFFPCTGVFFLVRDMGARKNSAGRKRDREPVVEPKKTAVEA